MASEHEGDPHDLRIVLLGVSGAGKSSTGNAILERKAFRESRTSESEIQRGRVDNRNISIIDTPGFFNTQLTDEEMKKQMIKSLDLSDPGPHVFLLIVNLENFEGDERNVLEEIEENFGAQAFKFTLVLFIGREKMSRRQWMLFIRTSTKLQELVSHCRDNYAINSENEMNQTQITKLLEKIDEIITKNDGQHYNNRIYECGLFGMEFVSQTKSIRIKKKQEEEKTHTIKEQDKSAWETFTAPSSREERTHTVIEEVNEITREKKQQEGENTYMKIKQEKGARKEQAEIKPETFEMENAMEERNTHTVTEVSYDSQTMKTTDIYENLNDKSLDRFEEFSNERMRDKNVDKTPEKSSGMSHKKTYQMLSKDDLRIVMVGKTGVGKSASGNTILGQKEGQKFKEELSTESVPNECQKHQQTVDCRNISVIDTPGLFDTSISKEQLKKEIVKCVEMSAPGPHAFLLVIRLDVRFTDEEKNTVEWIQKNFGKDAARYTIVLFTRGDQLKKTSVKDILTKNKQINELVSQCEGRYHVFNNTDEENRSQVNELLKKIDSMVMENGGQHYTNEMYKEAQRKIMMKKVKDTVLIGASVAGVVATGGLALGPIVIAHKIKQIKRKKEKFY